MSERDSRIPPERSSATGAWEPGIGEPKGSSAPGDPPTVRTGSAKPVVGSGSASGQAEGSGSSRQHSASRSDERMHSLPRAGDQFDGFVLEEAIGVGGMGAVFRAHDSQLDRQVAVKVLPQELAKDPEAVQRFYQEGRAAARLDHENIARVYTIGHASSYHYIAFEFIDGSTLRQLVERSGILSVSDAINFTLQIATALVHATERGVVHRDVKPSNIIVTPQGRAKLVDMGLARRFERGGDTGLTQTGMTLGTFDYISPEQARDPRNVDVRSDLYSLGCTMFYMLAGRPPFPDGTVLQKLLQHQEEPPPDVRSLNASVPADLAAILLKLMAKDRERRYQSPEQLVRDLLLVAGSLNLRSLSPEGLVWMDATPPPSWERHLVWGIPTLFFSLILLVLIWNGQQTTEQTPLPFSGDVIAVPPKTTKTSTPPTLAPTTTKVETPATTAPRDVIVQKSDDLWRLMSEAVPGTTLLLASDGPYEIRPGTAPLSPKDLTLQAGKGLAPVVKLAETPAAKTTPAIFDVKGGRLTIEGVEFDVDSVEREAPLAAIRTQDTELTLSHCALRREGAKAGKTQSTGLHLRQSPGEGAWNGPVEVVIDASHFDGGQTAIVTEGPVELVARDVTFGPSNTNTFVCGNKTTQQEQRGTLRFERASIMSSKGPVFSFTGLSPRVRLNESVIAATGQTNITLVASEDPTKLDWRGRDNLYGGIGTFLQGERGAASFVAIRSLDAWLDDGLGVREADSTLATAPVWADADPAFSLANHSTPASSVFRLNPRASLGSKLGARRGPSGAIQPVAKTAAPPAVGEQPKVVTPPPTVVAKADTTTTKQAVTPAKPPDEEMPRPMTPMRDPGEEQPVEMPPPMEVERTDNPPKNATETVAKGGSTAARPAADTPNTTKPATTTTNTEPVVNAENLVRTATQLASSLGTSDGRATTIRLAADADFEMSSSQLKGMGSWVIQGEPGKTRPRIRFHPRVGDTRLSEAWTVLFHLISGSLRLERVDLVLPKESVPQSGGWGAFAVAPGTDLVVNDCTVTIEGSASRSSMIVAPAVPHEVNAFGDEEPQEQPTVTVRLKDSLFRVGGDLVDVAADRRVDIEIDNAIIATTGSLLHGHGRVQGSPAEPLKITLRKVTSRLENGLIQLESTVKDPELPLAYVVARESVFSTNGKGAPLIQVDGQEDASALRSKIKWEGSGVAYNGISMYRRDQVLKPGEFPEFFDRLSWERIVGRKELGSIHGTTMFQTEFPADRPAWAAQSSDFRLKPDSTAAKSGAGSDLKLIPDPPAES